MARDDKPCRGATPKSVCCPVHDSPEPLPCGPGEERCDDGLERKMQIAYDVRKRTRYNKHTGLWYWYDADDPTTEYGPFPTFLEALNDAVEPYSDEWNERKCPRHSPETVGRLVDLMREQTAIIHDIHCRKIRPKPFDFNTCESYACANARTILRELGLDT